MPYISKKLLAGSDSKKCDEIWQNSQKLPRRAKGDRSSPALIGKTAVNNSPLRGPTKGRKICAIKPKTYCTYETKVLKRLQGTIKKNNSNYNMHTTLDNIPTAGKSITNNLINTTEVQFQLLQKTFGKLNTTLLSSVVHFAS